MYIIYLIMRIRFQLMSILGFLQNFQQHRGLFH